MRCSLIFALCALLLSGNAQAEERISNFSSYITVQPDGSLLVTETITANAEGMQIKRGIYRDFPTKYKDEGHVRKAGFKVVGVMRDGQAERYHIEDRGSGWKRVYIGRKDYMLPYGEHTFTLSYVTTRQLRYFKDHDEVYWNVTGQAWTFPIDHAEAMVRLPQGANVMQKAAYTGAYGSQGNDYITGGDDTYASFETTRTLHQNEGFTVAVAFPKGFVAEQQSSALEDNLVLLAAIIGVLIVGGYYFIVWNKVGRDPQKGTVIPLFHPPKNFTPGMCNYLQSMGFELTGGDTKSFSATIISLAVKGYIKIEEEQEASFLFFRGGKTYSLRKLKDFDGADILPDEKAVGEQLFGSAKTIKIGKRDDENVQGALSGFREAVAQQIKGVYFTRNTFHFLRGIGVSAIALLIMSVLSGEEYAAMIFATIITSCFVIGFATVFLVVTKSRVLRNFVVVVIGIAALVVSAAILHENDGEAMSAFLGAFTIICLNCLFLQLLKAPTAFGQKLIEQIEGFKMYLSVAEEKRLDKLNPPEVTPEVFEKYLPYAIALGLENEWGQKFTNYMAAASIAVYNPVWYHGSNFNISNMGSFSDNIVSGITESVTSSSSSSGSGGGGFSGGGGGGGGGGGW